MKRKKWLQKTAVLCTAMVLSATSIPSAAFAADSYADIEKSALAKIAGEFAASYATSLEQSQDLVSGIKGDITVNIEDSGRSLLGFVAPFDVSWLNNASVTINSSFKDNKEGGSMALLVNDSQVCTLDFYFDPDTEDMYMKVPELSDKYMKVNLKETEDDETLEASTEGLSDSVKLLNNMTEAMPEASVVESLLNKYGTILIDNVKSTDGTSDTLTAGDVSQDCTVYEGTLDSEAAVRTLTAVLETAKSDKEIEAILEKWAAVLPDSQDLKAQFQEAVDSGLDALKEDSSDEDSQDGYFSSKTWVGEDGEIIGRSLTMHDASGDTPVFTWQMPKNDSSYGYLLEIYAEDEVYALSGNGTIENDILNGSYQFSMNDEPAANIEVKDYNTAEAKKGNINGSYSISFVADESDDSSDVSPLANFSLDADIASTAESGSVKLGIVSAGATLGSVSFVSGKGDGVDIPDLASLKDVCDVSNDDDMTDYVSSMDFTKLMDNFTAAGVPDEVITYILSGGSSDTDTEIDDESIN